MYRSSRSPIVEMELITNGEKLAVAKSGPDYLILASPAQIPAGEAELIVAIEGETTSIQLAVAESVDGRRVELVDSRFTSPRPIPASAPALA